MSPLRLPYGGRHALAAPHHVGEAHGHAEGPADDHTDHHADSSHARAHHGALALELRQVGVVYPGAEAPAVEDVSWTVPVGARMALLGPNGSGKSTLLKAIVGLLPLANGELRVYGHPAGACPHLVAYLPQRAQIDWRFPISLRRLVLTGRYVHLGWLRRPDARDREIVERVIARLGLSDLADRQIGELSGGQQQRALIARALAQEADLILLDEPLNAVDADTRAIIVELLDELKEQGRTVVLCTHILALSAAGFDGVLYLEQGRVVPTPVEALGHATGSGGASRVLAR